MPSRRIIIDHAALNGLDAMSSPEQWREALLRAHLPSQGLGEAWPQPLRTLAWTLRTPNSLHRRTFARLALAAVVLLLLALSFVGLFVWGLPWAVPHPGEILIAESAFGPISRRGVFVYCAFIAVPWLAGLVLKEILDPPPAITADAHPKSRAMHDAVLDLRKKDFTVRLDGLEVWNVPSLAWLDATVDVTAAIANGIGHLPNASATDAAEVNQQAAALLQRLSDDRQLLVRLAEQGGRGVSEVRIDLDDTSAKIQALDQLAYRIERYRRWLPEFPRRPS